MSTTGIEIHPRKEAFQEGISALTGLATSVVSDVMGRTIGAVSILPVNKSSVSVCGNAVTVSVRAGDNIQLISPPSPQNFFSTACCSTKRKC